MSGCDKYLEQLSCYVDGELSEVECSMLEGHISECSQCSNELDILKTIVSVCRETEEDLPEGFETSLHKRLEEAKDVKNTKTGMHARVRLFSQIAAGVVLILTLGLFVRFGLFETNKMGRNESSTPMAPQGASPEIKRHTSAVTMDSAMMAKGEEDYEQSDGKELHVMFSEASYLNKAGGQDLLVNIVTQDVAEAVNSILLIETRLERADTSNRLEITNSLQAYQIEQRDEQIEIVLFYPDDAWPAFVNEIQMAFPDLMMESVPAEEEIEYIRIYVSKKN